MSKENKSNKEKGPSPFSFGLQFQMNYGGKSVDRSGKKVTHPDMSLTVRQLLVNHSRQAYVDAENANTAFYFDTEVPVIRDVTDVFEYRTHLQNQMNAVNKWLEDNPPDTWKDRNKPPKAKPKEEEPKPKEDEK